MNATLNLWVPQVMELVVYLALTLTNDHRLNVFEKKILKRIFEPKEDENVEWINSITRNLVIYILYCD